MDLAMVKQEQGETLRKYMRRFFDKRATVVGVTDKEVIDLLRDGLFRVHTKKSRFFENRLTLTAMGNGGSAPWWLQISFC
jgi:hypothetical protein